jgi:hypothetical protein
MLAAPARRFASIVYAIARSQSSPIRSGECFSAM